MLIIIHVHTQRALNKNREQNRQKSKNILKKKLRLFLFELPSLLLDSQRSHTETHFWKRVKNAFAPNDLKNACTAPTISYLSEPNFQLFDHLFEIAKHHQKSHVAKSDFMTAILFSPAIRVHEPLYEDARDAIIRFPTRCFRLRAM